MSARVWLRRVYDEPSRNEGYRILVDRVWPRGVSREAARLDEWSREVSPSGALRRWFGHDPERWEEFRRRYRGELEGSAELDHLVALASRRRITLVYGARHRERNQAVVLRELVEERLASGDS